MADKMVHLGYVEHISPKTVRTTLKKSWCFPKEADGEFVYHMEDVLDVSCQHYDPAVPRICLDEMGKNQGIRQVSPRTRPRPDKWRGKTTATKKKAAPTCSLPMNR